MLMPDVFQSQDAARVPPPRPGRAHARAHDKEISFALVSTEEARRAAGRTPAEPRSKQHPKHHVTEHARRDGRRTQRGKGAGAAAAAAATAAARADGAAERAEEPKPQRNAPRRTKPERAEPDRGRSRSSAQRRRAATPRAPLPAAKRELVISVDVGEQRVAVLEDGQVAEVYLERPERRSIAGNIYKGKVDNVLPGMEAAFVEIGLEKNGFLFVDEIVDARARGPRPAQDPGSARAAARKSSSRRSRTR